MLVPTSLPSLRVFLAAAVFLAAPMVTCAKAKANEAKRPNIILIFADDLGYAELGCYGQEKIKTPHIDRLAAEGMRFTEFYCGAPVCAPSRCVLMTGKHLGHAYVRDNWEQKSISWEKFGGQLALPKDTVTIARLLKRAGYVTGAFGKWGLGGVETSGDPLNQGFDRFFGYNCQRHAHNFYPRYLVDDDHARPLPGNDRKPTGETYAPQVIADELLKFVRSNRSEPFFVYYPTIIPHLALQVPDEELKPYLGKWSETPYRGRSYLPHKTPRACYAAMISFMDKQVGRIMSLLDELGIADNTVVLFTSDNGTTYLQGQVDYDFFESVGPLRGLKGSAYEGGIRVPLVVRWPGRVPAGTTSGHISAAYDLLPTLCAMAGTNIPKDTDGINLMPTLSGKTFEQKPHDHLVWEFHGYGGIQAVRMGKWKAVRTACFKNPDGPIELFNLEEDLGEKDDVAAKHPDVVRKITEIMKRAHGESEHWDYRKGHPARRKKAKAKPGN